MVTKERELELVKEIIWDGYNNLAAISYELDIPILELINLKRQVDTEKRQLKEHYDLMEQNRRNRSNSLDKMRSVT